jgi:DHA1 family bicyclomycin/chloramphenicol resistance-like MFS transporter
MLAAVLTGVGGAYGVLLPLVFYMIGSGLILPNAMAGSVSPFPTMAATASALSGVLQMGLAALLGLGIAMAFDGTALPMTCGIALSGALVFAASRLQKV